MGCAAAPQSVDQSGVGPRCLGKDTPRVAVSCRSHELTKLRDTGLASLGAARDLVGAYGAQHGRPLPTNELLYDGTCACRPVHCSSVVVGTAMSHLRLTDARSEGIDQCLECRTDTLLKISRIHSTEHPAQLLVR